MTVSSKNTNEYTYFLGTGLFGFPERKSPSGTKKAVWTDPLLSTLSRSFSDCDEFWLPFPHDSLLLWCRMPPELPRRLPSERHLVIPIKRFKKG